MNANNEPKIQYNNSELWFEKYKIKIIIGIVIEVSPRSILSNILTILKIKRK